jgi:hypothetical protein
VDLSNAITIWNDMALERAVDPVLRDVSRSYNRKLDELLDAVFLLARERDPNNQTCPMCGGGIVQANEDATHCADRPRGRGGWLSTSLAAGMGVGAIAGALAAVGLQHLFKVERRSRSERLVALLRAQPGRPIAELTQELYGSDSPSNRHKVRALLAQLGRLGRLRNVGHGRWEAVGDDVGGGDEDEELAGGS